MSPAVEAQSLNHWTTREVHQRLFLKRVRNYSRVKEIKDVTMQTRSSNGSPVEKAKSYERLLLEQLGTFVCRLFVVLY